MSFTADLHLQFGDPPLQAEQLLLQGCLFSLQRGDLLLYSAILRFLEVEMPLPKSTQFLHLLLNADQLVRKTLLDVCSLHGKDRLQGVLFTAQDLYLLLVVVELVGNVFDLLLDKG